LPAGVPNGETPFSFSQTNGAFTGGGFVGRTMPNIAIRASGGISFDVPLARTCGGNCFLPNLGSTIARVDLGNISSQTVRAGLGVRF
jgi:hypothetical protein